MRLRGEGGERTGDELACAWPRRRRFGSVILAALALAQVSPPSQAAADVAVDIPAGDLSTGLDTYVRLPSYGIADAAISYQNGDFSADVKIDSLSDKQAVAPGSAATYLAMESSRSALPTMRHRF